MSAIKAFLHDFNDAELAVDETMYAAETALAKLADLCWSDDGSTAWAAPHGDLRDLRASLKRMSDLLGELEQAKSCVNAG